MAHATLETPEVSVVLEPGQAALRSAVGAVSMLGDDEANALMRLSDEELGHLIKSGLSQIMPVARRITLDLPKVSEKSKEVVCLDNAELLERPKADAADVWDKVVDKDKILKGRQALVRSKQLIPAAVLWEGLGVTKQALSKAVKSGRVFTVDVGAATYYPAFYLDTDFDRKELAKVTQMLGSLPGWSKYEFFTTPSDFLDQTTPLKALSRGMVDEVKKLALAFIER
ncbi:hypothetical protein AWB75_06243 [Caballeronia catudaia]|uniref:Uncharacterized protein n=1 Tax=Caballeronia catudaia TaxID=1777136 RepID=A0A158D5I5_9BURK|nr:hypothetical protein [Caballeronia catudaia]SAK89905.1 hypothetical protein AWB75_06243 [Caballeronia catudaia]